MKIFQASILFVALGALVSVGMAQGPMGAGRMGGPGGMRGSGGMRGKPGEREKKMLSQVNLTPSQKKKTDAIIDEQSAKIMKMMKASGGGRPTPDQMTKFKAMRSEYEAKIEKVLTPAQVKQLKALRAAAREKRGMRGPGGPGAAAPGAGAPPKP
jgi:Spy/CpxP family protein refolding chaperone